MTILFVSIEFNYCCGISQSIFALCKELKRKGYRIILGAPGGTMVNEFVAHGMEFEQIHVIPEKKKIADFVKSISKIRKIVKKYKVDIIHSHNRLADFLSLAGNLLLNKPRVVTAHALLSGNKHLSFRADRIIAVSEAVRDMLVNEFEVAENRISLIRNIPRKLNIPSQAEQDQFRNDIGVHPNEYIVGAIGRLHKEKGFDVLLEAIRIHNDNKLKLVLVGKGDEKEHLEAYAKKQNLNVVFLNELDRVELIYSIADVIAIPSRLESAGLVALEAAYFKKPVVASKVGGLPETIKQRATGILVDPGNAEQLSDAIKELMDNKQRAAEYGFNLYDKVSKEYDVSAVAASMELIYKQVTHKNGVGKDI